MPSTPLSELSGSRAMAQDNALQLFPLKSGPHFGDASLSRGASGVVFTGFTRDARPDNDAFSCCGSYTLRNSVHAAIAGTTSDGCTVFALKSVIDRRPCLAVGGFDCDGKPVELTNAQFEQVTAPLFNFASNVSPILGNEPAPGIQLRNGNSTYGFQYNARSERYVFSYNNRFADGFHSSGPADFEATHNLSVESDGRRVSKLSAGGSLRQMDQAVSASAFQDLTSRGFEATLQNGKATASIAKTLMGDAQTRKISLGYDRTSIFHEKTADGKVTERLEHRLDDVTLEVSRTRDRERGTEYMLTFKFKLP
ncbi:hypothetical protein GGQ73_001812 [Rhizobium skierniewicense]|uniref:Uncharacterized protein n=1 Tax=Rhizobium skierniewicense TaxID=984260 RepID=A0A7W6G1K8_9HYPH|nr:hypothetical protein [Rhizobium skierniewicense]MBB3945877.1 hypothetical protein [Rhizobium skierniewicense]